MNEAKDIQDKKLTLSSGPRTLQLKKTVDTGQVRQSFSHGRSKPVVVERKKKRIFTKTEGQYEEVISPDDARVQDPVPPEAAAPNNAMVLEIPDEARDDRSAKGRVVLKTLTDDEKSARAKALEGAMKADREARERAAVEKEDESRERAKHDAEREAAETRRRGEEERKRVEEEVAVRAVKAEEDLAQKMTVDERRQTLVEQEARQPQKRGAAGHGRPAGRRSEPWRRSGKLTVSNALDDRERQRSLASVRRAQDREKKARSAAVHEPPRKVVREVVLPDVITVQELANRMAVRAVDVIRALMEMDVMASVNQTLDQDTAELVVEQFGHNIKRVSDSDIEDGLSGETDKPEDMEPRAPVVTVMGHVDHGKTSLLDALRETDVVAGEAGGITQHIGAYQVQMAGGQKITFLDTPGHEAFSAMRARGAKVTDIVVLVVAADDGVMPQTVEAINHAKAAEVPLIIAINKIDKPGADPNQIRQGLLQHEIVCEEMGGDALNVEVSALKKTNLEKLEETILLQAEVLELKANRNRNAEGAVIEARIDTGRGAVATVLVQRGTLRVGDVFVAGHQWGRVRALIDDKGQDIREAGPSEPVEVLGFQGTPAAGDDFAVVESESRARQVAEFRERRSRDLRVESSSRKTLEQFLAAKAGEGVQEFPIIIKADVQGSAEAINGALEKVSTDEVATRVLHSGVGGVTESDVTFAAGSKALIVGFNVRAPKVVRDLAQAEGVEIRYYSVIYDLVDDLKAILSGMLAPTIKETILGTFDVKEVFNIGKVGRVAGGVVTDGVVQRSARARIMRDNIVLFEGEISSLRRFKDEVKEVKSGTECGVAFENYHDLKPGDVVEVFEVEEIIRTL